MSGRTMESKSTWTLGIRGVVDDKSNRLITSYPLLAITAVIDFNL